MPATSQNTASINVETRFQNSRSSVCHTGICETDRYRGPRRAFFARESSVLACRKAQESTSGPNGVGPIALGARESHRKRRRDIDSGVQVLRERTDFWKSTMGAKIDPPINLLSKLLSKLQIEKKLCPRHLKTPHP